MPAHFFRHIFWSLGLALLLGCFPAPGQAQSQSGCKQRPPTPTMQAAMYDLAALVADTLDTLPDVDVLIAARSGRDLRKYGVTHSHLGFLLRDAHGHWQAIHLLIDCQSPTSSLYREGLVNFIGDTAARPAGLRLGVPVPALRAGIIDLLSDAPDKARALHQPHYNAGAYPWRSDYQNSNQWPLEVIAAAMAALEDEALDTREASTAWLQHHGYVPSTVRLGLAKRLAVRFFIRHATARDHPPGERSSGRYSVVTVESIFDFLHRHHALEQEMTLVLPQSATLAAK